MTGPASAVIYRGASRLDGKPITVTVTGINGGSKNAKTGPVAQVWIVLESVAPHIAARDGSDASICGECPLRRQADGGRACYVRTDQAPLSVWKADQRGRYPTLGPAAVGRMIGDRPIRLGAYGDPAAVPARVWRALLGAGGRRRHMGYSHQWRRFSALRPIVMASVESADDAALAQSRGWRTFRVRPAGAPLADGEIDCPAVTRNATCHDCGLCAGASLSAKNISIEAHGPGAKLIGA